MKDSSTMLTVGTADFIGTADDVYKAYQALLALQRVGCDYDWEASHPGKRHYYYNDDATLKMESLTGMPEFSYQVYIYPNREKAKVAIQDAQERRGSADDCEEDAA